MVDVAALARPFDYLVPAALDEQVQIGTIVRVPLHGRRVRGWVVGRAAEPETDRRLQAIAKVTGYGPTAELIDLAHWAAWRWAGSRATFLRAASPDTAVRGLPAPQPSPARTPTRTGDVLPRHGEENRHQFVGEASSLEAEAFAPSPTTVRLPPAADPLPIVLAAAARGDTLVLVPTRAQAGYLAARLRRAGHAVALLPGEWAMAAAGGCVAIGARGAAWAPLPRLAAVVVLDEHDQSYQAERVPTWNARDVARERARRAGAPCALVSPCPSLESLATTRLVTLSRADERGGWPVVEIVDRRGEAPGLGLYSERLVTLLRQSSQDERVVCVLNRKGRARLLACASCDELARCAACSAVVETRARAAPLSGGDGGDELVCRRCRDTRPVVCLDCGAGRLKALRIGVSRVREELELLAGRPVAELTGDHAPGAPPDAAVVVGTSAVLHRLARARAVVFLDFDQELMAPRYRAAEEAMALLVHAARLVGGREEGGRVVVQTRLPQHEVIDAAVGADPSRLSVVESARRAALAFPPERALALVSGDDADVMVAKLSLEPGIEVLGPALPAPGGRSGPALPAPGGRSGPALPAPGGRSGPSSGKWLVRAPDHRLLCDALAATRVLKGGPRVAVDPLQI